MDSTSSPTALRAPIKNTIDTWYFLLVWYKKSIYQIAPSVRFKHRAEMGSPCPSNPSLKYRRTHSYLMLCIQSSYTKVKGNYSVVKRYLAVQWIIKDYHRWTPIKDTMVGQAQIRIGSPANRFGSSMISLFLIEENKKGGGYFFCLSYIYIQYSCKKLRILQINRQLKTSIRLPYLLIHLNSFFNPQYHQILQSNLIKKLPKKCRVTK